MRTARVGLGGLLEEHEGEEPSQSDRHQVDHDTGDDVIDAEVDGGHRMHRREKCATESAEQESEDHSAGAQAHPFRGGPGEDRHACRAGHCPDHHQALEADVHDPRPFAEQSPETGEIQDREVRERDPDRRADIADVHQASSASASGASVSRSPTSAPARCSSRLASLRLAT